MVGWVGVTVTLQLRCRSLYLLTLKFVDCKSFIPCFLQSCKYSLLVIKEHVKRASFENFSKFVWHPLRISESVKRDKLPSFAYSAHHNQRHPINPRA